MTILITGGSGFLGAWVIGRLRARRHPVRVFDLVENRTLVELIAGGTSGIEWVTGDIADPAAVGAAAIGTSRIIHLAGLLTPACAADPVRGAQVNVIGALNVFEAARAQGHSAVVYTSSAAVFDPRDGRVPAPQMSSLSQRRRRQPCLSGHIPSATAHTRAWRPAKARQRRLRMVRPARPGVEPNPIEVDRLGL